MRFTTAFLVLLLLAAPLLFATGQQESAVPAADEPVVVTWWDWADSIQEFARDMFTVFEDKNPGITVEYSLMTVSQFSNAVTLAARSNDLPDVAPYPNEMTFLQAMDTGWYQPLDQFVEELWPGGLEAWMARYPDGTFVEGLSMYQGEVYTAPKNDGRYGTLALLYYNKDLMEAAGLDPELPPRTYAELREFAEKITLAGDGTAYGFIEGGKQTARWASSIGTMAMIGGALNEDGIDLRTGEYRFHDPSVIAAIELLKTIQDDGSYYPGYMAIDAREARALFGLGRAGFIIQGTWCVGPWKADNPDLNFGATFLPPPPSGRDGYIHARPNAFGGGRPLIASTSEHPEAAARLFLFRTTDEFYSAYARTGDGLSPIPALNTPENLPFPQIATLSELAQDEKRLAPIPTLRNPEGTAAIQNEFQAPSPNWAQIIQGYMSGQVADLEQALRDLSDKMNAELERAISAVRATGVDVSRDIYVFPNWDPMEEYTSADYEEL